MERLALEDRTPDPLHSLLASSHLASPHFLALCPEGSADLSSNCRLYSLLASLAVHALLSGS
jgi:hypothetical protein